jgi:hypothetical protein
MEEWNTNEIYKFNFEDLVTSLMSKQRTTLKYGSILSVSSALKMNQHLMITH